MGLAQAIIHNPDVLILDEPTAGLDPKQINETRDLIKGLAGDHTIILSTHILPEVEQTCEQVDHHQQGQDGGHRFGAQFDKRVPAAQNRCAVEVAGRETEALKPRWFSTGWSRFPGSAEWSYKEPTDGRAVFEVESRQRTGCFAATSRAPSSSLVGT